MAAAEDSPPGLRFGALHAWRGIAAVVVAVGHFNTTGWIGGGLMAANADRCVDFFFVLSGFVIAHAYREKLQRGELARFLLRRVGRLWPLHVASLAAVVAMAAAGSFIGLSVYGWTWTSLPAALTLTHSWGFIDRNVWNGPSWSISTEIFAYLLFALMASRLPARWLDGACAAALLASLLVLAAVAPEFRATHDYGVARCVAGFMAGVLAQRAWMRGLRPKGEIAAVLAAALGLVWLPLAFDAVCLPLSVWMVLVFAGEAGPVSRLLARPLPQTLGTVSYSIYMIHYPVGVALLTALLLTTDSVVEIGGLATFAAPWWIADLLSLAFLLVVLLLAQLAYAWIERPGRALFNARSERIPAAW